MVTHAMTDRPALLVLRLVEERFHRDDEERPIREGRTPREYLRAGEIEYRACPYEGSRHAHERLMNVSALKQTAAHWDEIVDALGTLRARYAAAVGSYAPDALDLWRVSQLGSALPWYFLLRGKPAPAYAAALAKATLGTAILAQRLLARALSEPGWKPPPLTAGSIAQLAEATGTLIGPHEVCAAPEKMIASFAQVLVAGEPTGAAPGLAAHADAAVAFGAHYLALKHWLWIYFLARRFLAADMVAAGAAPFAALLDLPCEPPDAFVVEPATLAELPLEWRRVRGPRGARAAVPAGRGRQPPPARGGPARARDGRPQPPGGRGAGGRGRAPHRPHRRVLRAARRAARRVRRGDGTRAPARTWRTGPAPAHPRRGARPAARRRAARAVRGGRARPGCGLPAVTLGMRIREPSPTIDDGARGASG
jgi:hypothetical protein